MSNIQFYYMPESPPCRLVEMVANITGVTLNKHYINLFAKEQLEDSYVKLNPLHKVPFIVDGDLKMNESRAIAAYLANKYQQDSSTFYPKDPVKRAQVDELLYFDAGTLYQACSKLFYPKFTGPVKEFDKETENAYRNVLSYLDSRLEANGGKKFVLGDELTLGDVAIASSFLLPEACEYNLGDFKNLVAYLDRLKLSIPKYKEVNEKPSENMKNYIKSKEV